MNVLVEMYRVLGAIFKKDRISAFLLGNIKNEYLFPTEEEVNDLQARYLHVLDPQKYPKPTPTNFKLIQPIVRCLCGASKCSLNSKCRCVSLKKACNPLCHKGLDIDCLNLNEHAESDNGSDCE